jgi:hypothetical protein
MNKEDIFDKVIELVQHPSGKTVSADEVQSWMRHPDIEVQGAAYQLLRKLGDVPVIVPSVAANDRVAFFRAYLERCFREDAEGDWTYSRYSTCWEIAGWMAALFENLAENSGVVAGLKDWLASAYLNGTVDERDALLNGALEHLFERPAIRGYFSDWASKPGLSQAYADACLWADVGGDSPLVGRTPRDSGRK